MQDNPKPAQPNEAPPMEAPMKSKTKRRRTPPDIEVRKDTDGKMYSRAHFLKFYGGLEQWIDAEVRPVPPNGKFIKRKEFIAIFGEIEGAEKWNFAMTNSKWGKKKALREEQRGKTEGAATSSTAPGAGREQSHWSSGSDSGPPPLMDAETGDWETEPHPPPVEKCELCGYDIWQPFCGQTGLPHRPSAPPESDKRAECGPHQPGS